MTPVKTINCNGKKIKVYKHKLSMDWISEYDNETAYYQDKNKVWHKR